MDYNFLELIRNIKKKSFKLKESVTRKRIRTCDLNGMSTNITTTLTTAPSRL